MIKRQVMLIAGALLGCSLLAFAGGTVGRYRIRYASPSKS